jgi:3-deoxy-D-manno-octulosonate 8-phosphate phosphatase (KDO 8-P phosphatase)
MPISSEVRARAAKVKILLMDVDGVLCDKMYFLPDSTGKVIEFKGFDAQDGIALQWCQWKGMRTGVISGRDSPSVTERARQCKMDYVYQGHIEKIPILEEIMADAKATAEEVAFIGDDLTDIVVMHRVGLGVAVANARTEVKGEAHYVTEARGGQGAVREVIELILETRGQWREILDKYEVRG